MYNICYSIVPSDVVLLNDTQVAEVSSSEIDYDLIGFFSITKMPVAAWRMQFFVVVEGKGFFFWNDVMVSASMMLPILGV